MGFKRFTLQVKNRPNEPVTTAR